ncbi:MAG TPA: hypothetical protein PLA10_06920 [Clostridiales bacterium]|nr:hypothetical protein [Clostridiales bacterium]
MIDLNTTAKIIHEGILETLKSLSFEPVCEKGADRKNPALKKRDEAHLMQYEGEKGKLRILFSGSKVFLLVAAPDAESEDDSDYKKVLTGFVDYDEYTEKDIRSLANDIIDEVENNFGVKSFRSQNVKMPTPVSRTQAKSGVMSYNPLTLANRLLSMYPELKEPYKQNIQDYGDFLPEDFFLNHANKYIHETIEQNDPQKMKKLFGILNEIFEDGTNETQGVIAVTILGAKYNDPDFMQKIVEYMEGGLLEAVVEVNKYLEKNRGARLRLEKPPIYKPKRDKKGGLMDLLLGGQPQQSGR